MAIRTVAQEKLYMHANPPYATLEAFFLARYCLSRAQVYRHLTCAYVVADLLDAPPELNVHPLPRKQRVAKAVKDLAPNARARQRLWASTLAHFPRGHEITSSNVCRVAASMGASLTSDEPFVLPGVHSQQNTPAVSVSRKRTVLDHSRQDRSLSPLLDVSSLTENRCHRSTFPQDQVEQEQHTETVMTPRVITVSQTPADHSAVMIMDHVITPTSPTFFASHPARSWSGNEITLTRSRAHSRGHSPRFQPYPPVSRGVAAAADAGLLSPPISPRSMTISKGLLHHNANTGSVSPNSVFHASNTAPHQYPRLSPDYSFLSSPVLSPTMFADKSQTHHQQHFVSPQFHTRSPPARSPSIAHQRQPYKFARPLDEFREHMLVPCGSPHASRHSTAYRFAGQPECDPLRLPPLVSPLVQNPSMGLSPLVAIGANLSRSVQMTRRRGPGYGAQMDWNCALPPMGELLYLADRVAQVSAAAPAPSADVTELGRDEMFRY
ncbi:hypothetical protein BCR44DRAFT_1423698 [Catenaria anguillulae PL171]|uniref:Uncharacterized protein n=1 Tax=Catenaria anguillulae PL171 TaxID=765915 RepID=A0A1Y2I1J5_9FUNG|nr:hypothetical protein BCR44DRAFT_1423698 [Catenaria anguillulae PL171]